MNHGTYKIEGKSDPGSRGERPYLKKKKKEQITVSDTQALSGRGALSGSLHLGQSRKVGTNVSRCLGGPGSQRHSVYRREADFY